MSMAPTELVRSQIDYDFTNRVVLVTGGAKGIGKVISERFLKWGADVMTCGRSEPDSLPHANGKTAKFVAADIRDADEAAMVVDTTVEEFGAIDTVINNAGGSPHAEAATASSRFSESIIRLNLLAPLHIAQRANHYMQDAGPERNEQVIINIASVSATRPSPGTAAYGAAKAGLLNLTQTLAIEWAPRVRVAAIVAGMILTEQAHLHYGDETGVAQVAATVPAQRLGSPDDVAQACAYLTSPAASYVSGSAIWLHGGGENPAFLGAASGVSS